MQQQVPPKLAAIYREVKDCPEFIASDKRKTLEFVDSRALARRIELEQTLGKTRFNALGKQAADAITNGIELVSNYNYFTDKNEFKIDFTKLDFGMAIQQVNTQKVMGAGLAKAIADEFPVVKKEYLAKPNWQLGDVQQVCVKGDFWIVNVAGQQNIGTDTRQTDFEALALGLQRVQRIAENEGMPVFIPHGLGSGLAGGKTKAERAKTWQKVTELIAEHIADPIYCNPQLEREKILIQPIQPMQQIQPVQTTQQIVSPSFNPGTPTTTVTSTEPLKKEIPVYDLETQGYLAPLNIEKSPIAQLLTAEELQQITAVKIDKSIAKRYTNNYYTEEDKKRDYNSQLDSLPSELDGKSEVVIANGGTVYMSTPEIATKVRDTYFAQQPDHCCRYGSMFLSSCNEGLETLKGSKIMVVDSESKIPQIKQRSLDLQTGDCHGKISRELATALGMKKKDHAFQFRAMNKGEAMAPFIAKGTFLIEDKLTSKQGFDLVIDRSSIKGMGDNEGPLEVLEQNCGDWQIRFKPEISNYFQQLQSSGVTHIPQDADPIVHWASQLPAKLQELGIGHTVELDSTAGVANAFVYKLHQPNNQQLDALSEHFKLGKDRIPTGLVEADDLVIGAMQKATIAEYNNSWQLIQWFSDEAIEKDILPLTIKEAEHLQSIQDDPILLKNYLIEQHEKQKQFLNSAGEEGADVDEEKENYTSINIEVMKRDKRNLLLNHPKIVEYCQQQLRNQWQKLATKGAVPLEAALAQPAEIKRGTVIAPHIKDGEEVIVTRYPIINKDNIRKYVVDNNQPGYKDAVTKSGCVFFNPQDAAEFHQMDFDGDNAVVTPARLLPNIAKETQWAKEDAVYEFPSITKRKKVPYDSQDLKRTALAISQNKIAVVANAIGQVWNSRPHPEAPEKAKKSFDRQKMDLMGKLGDALQIEVDSPKSKTRHEEVHGNLLKEIKDNPAYQLPFFQYKKDKNLYASAPMPEPEKGRGSVLDKIAEKVNQHWQQSKLKALNLEQFATVFPLDKELPNKKELDKQVRAIFDEQRDKTKNIFGNDKSKNKDLNVGEEISRIYEQIRNKIDGNYSAKETQYLAAKTWQTQHKSNAYAHRKKSMQLCHNYSLTASVEFIDDHQFKTDLKPQECCRVEMPYHSQFFAGTYGREDTALCFKEILEQQNIPFEAYPTKTRPTITFDLKTKDLSPEMTDWLANYSSEEVRNHNLKADKEQCLARAKDRNNSYSWRDFNKDFKIASYNKKSSNAQDVVMTPPKEYQPWLLVENEKKASLSFGVFGDEIISTLENIQINEISIVGEQKNDYKDVDIKNNPLYINQPLEFEVQAYNNPESHYDGVPIFVIRDPHTGMNHTLGMAAKDRAVTLPVGTELKGTLQVINNDLTLVPETIKTPERTAGISPLKEYRQLRNLERIKDTRKNKQQHQEKRGYSPVSQKLDFSSDLESDSTKSILPTIQSGIREPTPDRSSQLEP